MEPEAGFESSLRRLEATVSDLEGGDLGLDEALARYEAGVGLLARCYGMLDEAGRKVALLTGVEEDGTPTTEPFDASATLDSPPAVPKVKKPRKKEAASPPTEGLDDLPF